MTSAKPIHSLRELLRCYLIGSFSQEGEARNTPSTVMDSVDSSDVSIVCAMLRKAIFTKRDLLICLLSSLLGIISSDGMKNDHSLQNDIACKTIVLLTASDKEIRPSDAQQFGLILLLPLCLVVDLIPTKLNDIVSDNSMLDDLLNFASELINSSKSAKIAMENRPIIFVVRDILIGCYSLWYWQVVACRSSTKDIAASYKKFASSEIFRVTHKFLRYLFVANGEQPRTEDEVSFVRENCIENVCVIFGKIAKKFNKIPRKSMCILTPETSHSTSNRRKQAASLRRVAIKRDQRSSSESEKESEKDRDESDIASDCSDSTMDMSDYVLGASDSDDARPTQMKHKRNLSNTSARSKEGNI